jgi:hypothetical protein
LAGRRYENEVSGLGEEEVYPIDEEGGTIINFSLGI